MSLKVWLPLNGDLENKGVSNVNITANGASVNTSGKIGSCYSFDGSDDYISLDGSIFYDIIKGGTQPFSIAMWIYHNDSTRAILFGDYGLSGAIGFNIELTTAHQIRFYWNGSPDKNFDSNSSVGAQTWTHITLTYDGSQLLLYKNGAIISDKYSGALAVKTKSSGAYYLGRDSRTGTTALNGRLNDFRLYDHCLSAVEVKEISQGLVLHYKLDTHYLKSGTNLVTDVTKGGQTTKLTDGRLGVITSGVNADTYFTINLSESIVSGTTYYFSCDASGISNGQYWNFPLGAQNNTSLPCKIYNGHNEFVFTANNIDWGTNRLFMDDLNRTDWANPATFYNFVLTKDATYEVKDSSGYNNNGVITGALTLDSNSPRYSFAPTFTGTQCISRSTLGADIRTLSCWCKTTKNKSTSQHMVADSASGMCISFYQGNIIGVFGSTRSTGSKCVLGDSYKENDWNHIVVVKTSDDGQRDIYCNGVKLTPTSNDYWSPSTGFYVGARNTSNGNAFYGQIADVRAYATQLLDNDVISLYNVGMKIDNLSNIHTFEFDEEDKDILAGIPWTSPYSTHSTTQNLFTNYNSDGEPQFTVNGTSAGSQYIEITPGVYYYDTTISVNAGNQFYIGFERYDADKTSRSNQACVYIYTTKPSSDVVKQRYKGTVDLSTDSVNPLKYITLRVLNGWSGTNSGVTGQATIHHLSLRLVSGAQNPKLEKTGQLITSELKEMEKSSLYQNRLVEAAEFIER